MTTTKPTIARNLLGEIVMGRVVIVGYRARPGKQQQLEQLMKIHFSTLSAQGLVTDRAPITMQSRDGTIVEVFEWKSKQAIEEAHNNPVVQEMWGKYFEVCEFIPAGQIEEFSETFSEFSPGRERY